MKPAKYLNVTVISPQDSEVIRILPGSVMPDGRLNIDKVMQGRNFPEGKPVVYANKFELEQVRKNSLGILTGKKVRWLSR